MTEHTKSPDVVIPVLGKDHPIKSFFRERTSQRNDYQFDVLAGTFYDTQERDYAMAVIKAHDSTPMQRVERTEPIIDLPFWGKGFCVQYRPSTHTLTILFFSHQDPSRNVLTRTQLNTGETTTHPLGSEPQIVHQAGDYLTWISLDETLALYDICDQKPYEEGDLTDLNPLEDDLPSAFLAAVQSRLHPSAHLAHLLAQR